MNRQQLLRNIAEATNQSEDQPVSVVLMTGETRVKGFPLMEVRRVYVNDYGTIVVEVQEQTPSN